MIPEVDARQLSDKLAAVTSRVSEDYKEEDISGEEDFSSQLCGRLKGTLESYNTDSMTWQVRTAEAREGRGWLKARSLSKVSEEPVYGADIIMVMDAVGPGYQVKKGFLAQAKRLEKTKYLSASGYSKLREQCHAMLKVTASSYVFLYGTTGVTVISANAVIASVSQDLWSLPTWQINILYYDFAICWIGDYRLQTTSRRTLDDLRASLDANAAIEVLGFPRLEKGPPPRPRR